MAEIKPAEVSAILRQQLSGFKNETELEETGTILQVGDGIARVYGLSNAESGELVEFEKANIKGVVLNLEEDNVGIVLMGESNELQEGDIVKRTGKISSINVGEGLLGRVVNAIGAPLDGKGPIQGELYEMPLERKAPGVIFRQPVKEPLQTGIISLRNQSKGFMNVIYKGDEIITVENLLEFEEKLITLIHEILDNEIPFQQTENEDNCLYCAFREVCGR